MNVEQAMVEVCQRFCSVAGDAHDDTCVALATAAQGASHRALTDAANAWQWGQWGQWGQWADAPRCADRVQERIANAQYVTDWLRSRASRGAPVEQCQACREGVPAYLAPCTCE